MRMTADQDGFQDCRRKRVFVVLREQREMPRNFAAPRRLQIPVAELYRSCCLRPEARQGFQRKRFAAAIFAQDRDELAGLQRHGKPGNELASGDFYVDVVAIKQE